MTANDNGYIKIKPHTLHKYNILKKYLGVCKTFNRVYANFIYIDTHGGSGTVFLKSKKQVDGSPLIASNWNPNAPCHVIEIDPETYRCLCSSVSKSSNVKTYNGDCNEIIQGILSKIPQWQKFVFCFVDPSSLVYCGADGTVYDQVRASTIRTITEFPRTELLLNFPIESISRCAGDYFRNPTAKRAISNGERVTTFMGSDSWQNLPENHRNYRDFLEIYIDEMLNPYPFKGAILIRSENKNLPLYYLAYTTHNATAAKIMRDIMKKEGDFPLYLDMATGKPQKLDDVYPLKRFIFEN